LEFAGIEHLVKTGKRVPGPKASTCILSRIERRCEVAK
jgi:hypothetical protein